MKIAIIGDVHIGASYSLGKKDHITGRNTRLLDYEKTLEKTIDEIIAEECDTIIFTGDIFEHRHPNALYQKIFSQYLYYALSNGIKQIHIVVGNHDQQRISEATTISYLQELALPNISVHDSLSKVTILNRAGDPEINVLFMPYRDRKWLEQETYQEAIDKIDKDMKYLLSSIDNTAPKLLVGHMTIEGTFFADEYAELYSENELFLPKEMFKNIDVTIMGHVHTPYVVSKDPYIAYVGSMEKRGAFENHDKKFAIVDTSNLDVLYKSEPCRNIFDIKIDFSDKTHGTSLQENVEKAIDLFAQTNSLKKSIVRVILTISADDDSFCDPSTIEKYLFDKHGVDNCVPIKPSLYFSRQARDSKITEHASDAESFIRYIKNSIDDSALADDIISEGLDIIRMEGD